MSVAARDVLEEVAGYIGFDETDAAILREIGPLLEPSFDGIVHRFYEAIDRNPGARTAIRDEAQAQRLRGTLRAWLQGLFGGRYDRAYFEQRARIGRVHVRIGLAQRYMFSAMNLVREGLHEALELAALDADRRRRAHVAVDRICDVELAVMLETYREAYVERLRAAERAAMLGRLIEAVDALIVGLGEDGAVRLSNAMAARMLGSAASIEGRPFVEVAAVPADAERLRGALTIALGPEGAAREAPEIEVAVDHEDGPRRTRRIVRWSMRPLRGEVEGLAVLAVGHDVTDRLDAERRVAETEAMASLGTLAAGLAHEIRNPLNAARLQLELVSRAAVRVADPTARDKITHHVGVVGAEIGRLSTLLEEFLLLARPRDIERRAVELASLFDEVVTLETPVAEAHRASLSAHVEPGAERVRGDRAKLVQVLVNLVGNAIEAVAGNGGGHVELRARASSDDWVEVSVRDDGPGLPPEIAHQVFRPFVSSKPAGTGLGLCIVKKLVEQHGGHVELESPRQGGTLARFTLPRVRAEELDRVPTHV
ncbi:MAG: protoglobin domain-containing protein [Myxococcota bacterium]|nr:protoglobin domain-containing protein [Myxococcota bacterium]MDW8363434.1 protoglobin domain-containing protein [Myxococcales bacterium]